MIDLFALKTSLDFLEDGFTQWGDEKQLIIDAAKAYLKIHKNNQELIEKIAKTLCIEDGFEPLELRKWYKNQDYVEKECWKSYIGAAEAALEAIRDIE